MGPGVRIIVVSLFTGALGFGLGLLLVSHFGESPQGDGGFSIFLGFLGAIIGAIAGAAEEIVIALRQRRTASDESTH